MRSFWILFAFTAIAPQAAIARTCLPDNSLCEGDSAYAYTHEGLVHGAVTDLPPARDAASPDARANVDGKPLKLIDIARAAKSFCIAGSSICPGATVQGRDGQSGTVLGIFPTQYVVVSIAGGKPVSLRASDLFAVEPVAAGGCNEASGPITADDSPNKAYFQSLVARGLSAPIGDYLKLWYPGRPRKLADDDASYILRCESAPWMNFRGGADGFLTRDCTPDTLYSWGPPGKLSTMRQTMPDGASWSGSPNPAASQGLLWTTASAVATYPFGIAAVRVKLKAGVRVRVTGWGHHEDGVVGLAEGWAQDYAISDASIIDSWSSGTPEEYDEIVRDIRRFMSGKTGMHWSSKMAPEGTGLARLFSYGPLDNHENDEQTLKATLLDLAQVILAGQGRIQYARGACRSRARHFATSNPSYMNP